MTYSDRQPPPGSVTSEELAYSPYASAEHDFDATMMGAYEFAGATPLFPSEYVPTSMPIALPPRRVMQMPNYAPPPGYKLVPLSDSSGPRAGMTRGQKIVIAVVVVLVIGAVVYYIRQRKGKVSKAAITPTQAVKKLPTSRLAQNLYARLAKNGKASRGVLSALDKIAQE